MGLLDELERRRREHRERLQRIAIPEWKNAVKCFFEQIQGDLSEVLSRRLIKAQIDMAHKADPISGEYDIERLTLTDISTYGGKTIVFEPSGSEIVGADGQIDILDVGVRRCSVMWRAPSSWIFVLSHRQRGKARTERWPYSKDALESVVGELLLGPPAAH